jgi:hypothetical protein
VGVLERLLVGAWVDLEHVRHAGVGELAVEPLVLRPEAGVPPADVDLCALARRFAAGEPRSRA